MACSDRPVPAQPVAPVALIKLPSKYILPSTVPFVDTGFARVLRSPYLQVLPHISSNNMAPTSTTTAGAPSSTEFDGDDFSNNLFSDLAPLLTLFGEQVTKQFLSMSLGWADHVLLAMGPLGIITVVVSAIRVSGPKKLKAIIGRSDTHSHFPTAFRWNSKSGRLIYR